MAQQHTVVQGETLGSIAARYYGTADKWTIIYEANKAAIGPNPNVIRPGTVLTIPDQGPAKRYVYIQSKLNGMMLTVQGAGRTAGTRVVIAPRGSVAADAQLWEFTADGYIVNKLSGLVLDVSGGRPTPNSPVIIWSKNAPAADNQRWTASNFGTGPYLYIESKLTGNLVLDVQGGGSAAGTPVNVYTRHTPPSPADHQMWDIVPA